MKIKHLITLVVLCLLSCVEETPSYTVSVNSDGDGCVEIKDYESNFGEFAENSKVTVVATPNKNSTFVCWYVESSNEPISTYETYTFTVTKNIVLNAKFKPFGKWISVSAEYGGDVSIKGYEKRSVQFDLGAAVTVIATPDENYEFVGWFADILSETPISKDATYTFIVEDDINLLAKFKERYIEWVVDFTPSGTINGYDYVDLGLSVKWATQNIGANSIEDIGDYYAWGETTPYDKDLTFINYKWSFTPCSPDCVLASIFDAATVNWGKSWRMPTSAEQKELINGCEWIWIDDIEETSISGYIGKSKINGKYIFLPASQFVSHSSADKPLETDGVYWSSSTLTMAGALGFSGASTAECMSFTKPGMVNPIEISLWAMGKGATIRPVVGSPNDYFPDPSTNIINDSETERQGFTVNGKLGEYTYVDMGLPSRTLWATYNIGAELPTDYGEYFAWGETSPKETYTDENYKFFDGYREWGTHYQQFTKYVWDKDFGALDGKYILDYSDDAAYINWGNEWCMPTYEQIEELALYCDWWRKDITINGQKIIGYAGKSKLNGNTIYFPAAGWEYSNQPNSHMWVWYWTSNVSKQINSRAIYFFYDEDERCLIPEDGTNRCQGLTIRAVSIKK